MFGKDLIFPNETVIFSILHKNYKNTIIKHEKVRVIIHSIQQ